MLKKNTRQLRCAFDEDQGIHAANEFEAPESGTKSVIWKSSAMQCCDVDVLLSLVTLLSCIIISFLLLSVFKVASKFTMEDGAL